MWYLRKRLREQSPPDHAQKLIEFAKSVPLMVYTHGGSLGPGPSQPHQKVLLRVFASAYVFACLRVNCFALKATHSQLYVCVALFISARSLVGNARLFVRQLGCLGLHLGYWLLGRLMFTHDAPSN